MDMDKCEIFQKFNIPFLLQILILVLGEQQDIYKNRVKNNAIFEFPALLYLSDDEMKSRKI